MNIQINEFTGPLDLLLQLIRREEMDIFDIDIHKITEQYLVFIKEHPIEDLDSAGDFIRMAALLIYIKSKSLFPSESADLDVEEEVDIQKNLVQSLLKMQVVQSVCGKLNQYSMLNRDVWKSGGEKEEVASSGLQKMDIKQQPIMNLMRTYRHVFQKVSERPAVSIKDPLPFLTDYIRSIHSRLTIGASLKMSSLVKNKNEHLSYTLVTFLALLELGRLGIVSLEQNEDFDDIAVFVKKQFNDKDFHSIREMEGTSKLSVEAEINAN